MTMLGFSFCARAYGTLMSVRSNTNKTGILFWWTIANLQSVGFQACGPKLLANAFDQRCGRWLCVLARVIDAELLPFVSTHLMKRQHVYTLDDAQSRCESGDLIDIVFVVSQIRN